MSSNILRHFVALGLPPSGSTDVEPSSSTETIYMPSAVAAHLLGNLSRIDPPEARRNTADESAAA